jgi:LysR family transcriptional regulator, cyn operon transcriptional activator
VSIDLKVLRYCEAVARHGSFTKAAEELRIAQPALSIAIKKLETELGVILFARKARHVVASPEAELLLQRAARIFDEVTLAREEIQAASELKIGEVKIGFPPMYGQVFFPRIFAEFHKQFPSVVLTAVEGSADSVRKLLDAGAIDVGMLESRRVPGGWQAVEVGRDETVLCVSASHKLAGKKFVEPKDLEGLPMVVFDSTFLQRNVLEELCRAAGVKFRLVLQSNHVPTIREAVAADMGAATLIRSIVRDDPRIQAVSFRPQLRFRFSLCWRHEKNLTKACRTFIDFAQDKFETPAEER